MLITINRAITCKTSLLPTMPSTITKRSDYEHIRLCEEKQPFTDVPQKGCSYKFRRKTPVLESLNKVADHQLETLLKKRLKHESYLVNFAKFLRKTFSQITFGRLLLYDAELSKIRKLKPCCNRIIDSLL